MFVKDQTTASENGIYVAGSSNWTRATDFATGTTSVTPEVAVRVSEGTVNAHTAWFLVTQGTIDVGTTALTFEQWPVAPTYKQVVLAATTGSITLSGTQTVDGVALAAGNRVLVKDQSTPSANGIYVVASGAWVRAGDAASAWNLTPETTLRVSDGTANAHTEWSLTTQGPITLGSTALTFAQRLPVAVADDVARSGGPGTAINRVQGIRGRTIAATAPAVGESYVWDEVGTSAHKPGKPVPPNWFDVKRYGAVGDGVTDDTDEIDAAFAACLLAGGGIVFFPKGIYCISRTINVRTGCSIRGSGGEIFFSSSIVRANAGVTAFRVWALGGPDASGSPDAGCADIAVEAAGKATDTGTCNYTASGTSLTSVSGGTWVNGQLISIEGVGNQVTLAETQATTTSGSNQVVLSHLGDLTPVIRVGQYLLIGTAYTVPTKVIAASGTTLTMASNAAGPSLSGAAVKYCAPLLARIVSVEGTSTLTIDAVYGGITSITGAELRHADAGFDLLNAFHFTRVIVGGSGGGFAGPGFASRGSTVNNPATNTNTSTLSACRVYENRFGVYSLGNTANASRFHVIGVGQVEWTFIDMSLGNTYSACHADGGQGYLTMQDSCRCLLSGCYAESGTFVSAGNVTVVIGGTMPTFCGGTRVPSGDIPYIGLPLAGSKSVARGDYEGLASNVHWVGSPGGTCTVTFFSGFSFRKWIYNALSDSSDIVVKTDVSTASVTIPAGMAAFVQSDGIDMYRAAPNVVALNDVSHLVEDTPQTTARWGGSTVKSRITQATTTTATANQVIEAGTTADGVDFSLADNAVTRIAFLILVKKASSGDGGSIEVKADYTRNGGAPSIIGSPTITYNLSGTTLDGTTLNLNVSSNAVELRASPESADTLSWRIVREQSQVTT